MNIQKQNKRQELEISVSKLIGFSLLSPSLRPPLPIIWNATVSNPILPSKSLFTARYYETGEFQKGERGTRVVFSWAKIIGQYVFWFGSFYAQYQVSRLFLLNLFFL